MTPSEATREIRKREDAWAMTEIGKLFYTYEQALIAVWVKETEVECLEVPSKRLKELRTTADEARAAFLAKLRELG
jgi:hypothetical protein